MINFESRRAEIEKEIIAMLEKWGIPENAAGHPYFNAAIWLELEERDIIAEPIGKVYPALAKQFGVTPDHAASIMENAIEQAWEEKNEEIRIFDECPTAMDVIDGITEELRLKLNLYEGADIVRFVQMVWSHWIALKGEKGVYRGEVKQYAYQWEWRGYALIAPCQIPRFDVPVTEKRSGRLCETLAHLEEMYQKDSENVHRKLACFPDVMSFPTKEELENPKAEN